MSFENSISLSIQKSRRYPSKDWRRFQYSGWKSAGKVRSAEFGLRIAEVKVRPSALSADVEYYEYPETHKEHFLDFIFFQPDIGVWPDFLRVIED